MPVEALCDPPPHDLQEVLVEMGGDHSGTMDTVWTTPM